MSAVSCLGFTSNMSAIVFVLHHVARVLPLVIDLVLLQVGFEHVVRAHSKNLGGGDHEVEQVHDFDFGVLLVERLILFPMLPRAGISQFRGFLGDAAGELEQPVVFLRIRHLAQWTAAAHVQVPLQAEHLLKLVWNIHK